MYKVKELNWIILLFWVPFTQGAGVFFPEEFIFIILCFIMQYLKQSKGVYVCYKG